VGGQELGRARLGGEELGRQELGRHRLDGQELGLAPLDGRRLGGQELGPGRNEPAERPAEGLGRRRDQMTDGRNARPGAAARPGGDDAKGG
jgi:hypothetical protein